MQELSSFHLVDPNSGGVMMIIMSDMWDWKKMFGIIPVMERSEDTGLSICSEAGRKVTMKDYFSLEEQRSIAEKKMLNMSSLLSSLNMKFWTHTHCYTSNLL